MGDYDRHEALDRTSLLCDILGKHLMDHQFIQSRPDLLKDLEAAQSLIAGVYQRIGTDHLVDGS